MSNKEKRFYVGAQIRAAGDEGALVLRGYAAVFNQYSQDLGGFKERIKPGAFRNVLRAKPDVKFLVNHDASMLLGRSTNGTLEMTEDDTGLAFRVKLPNTTLAKDSYELIKRGDMSQCSFSFQVDPDGQDWGEDSEEDPDDRTKRVYFPSRTIREISQLFDLSCVTSPAYKQTSVDARDLVPAEVRSVVEALNFARKIVPRSTDPNLLPEAEAETLRRSLLYSIAGQ